MSQNAFNLMLAGALLVLWCVGIVLLEGVKTKRINKQYELEAMATIEALNKFIEERDKK